MAEDKPMLDTKHSEALPSFDLFLGSMNCRPMFRKKQLTQALYLYAFYDILRKLAIAHNSEKFVWASYAVAHEQGYPSIRKMFFKLFKFYGQGYEYVTYRTEMHPYRLASNGELQRVEGDAIPAVGGYIRSIGDLERTKTFCDKIENALPKSVSLRLGTEKDLEEVIDLAENLAPCERRHILWFSTREEHRKVYLKFIKLRRLWVATVDGRVCAFVRFYQIPPEELSDTKEFVGIRPGSVPLERTIVSKAESSGSDPDRRPDKPKL